MTTQKNLEVAFAGESKRTGNIWLLPKKQIRKDISRSQNCFAQQQMLKQCMQRTISE